jgi:hypothetical protein
MSHQQPDRRRAFAAVSASGDPPEVGLTHGSAMWVLRELGFSEGASDRTFNYYVKSLRKLGVPFSPGQNRYWSGRLARYSYEHLMELALALTLRVYGVLPDSVLGGLIRYRGDLNAIYHRTYSERTRVMTARFRVEKKEIAKITLHGVYLDLQIGFSGGKLVRFGPPRVIRPDEAIRFFARERLPSRSLPPIHVSELADRIIQLAARAPDIRRGSRRKQTPEAAKIARNV